MIRHSFTYTAPSSLREALSLLKHSGTEVFTGDQAYVTGAKLGHSTPSSVISLRNLSELKSVVQRDDQLIIGSSITFAELLESNAIQNVPVLLDAIRVIRDPHLKNHSNVGGALLYQSAIHGSILAAFLVLEGTLSIVALDGERELTLSDYLTEGLRIGEVIKCITLNINPNASGSFHAIDYLKSGKVVCGIAALVNTKAEVISQIRLAVCGCVEIPQRLVSLENSLIGLKASSESLSSPLDQLQEHSLGLYNVHISSTSYLLNLLKVLIKRAVLKS